MAKSESECVTQGEVWWLTHLNKIPGRDRMGQKRTGPKGKREKNRRKVEPYSEGVENNSKIWRDFYLKIYMSEEYFITGSRKLKIKWLSCLVETL